MRRTERFIFVVATVLTVLTPVHAEESDLMIFGYYQTQFQDAEEIDKDQDSNSFMLQQLNLFFQKELTEKWTSFVDIEFLNSFSSKKGWGSAAIEEAWVRYTPNNMLNIKTGLLIPQFNNMNEIKNKTPLLPYVYRPIVYESSLSELFPLEEFVPETAFLQVYGTLPKRNIKIDYAVYLGNSPNVNSFSVFGQSGADTTGTMLAGGRIGLRYKELKAGMSFTSDTVKQGMDQRGWIGDHMWICDSIDRYRYGLDISWHYKKFHFECEAIEVDYDQGSEEYDLDKEFFYATAGYDILERLYIYTGFWVISSEIREGKEGDFEMPTAGFAYRLNDRVTFKSQFSRHSLKNKMGTNYSQEIDSFNVALSVFF